MTLGTLGNELRQARRVVAAGVCLLLLVVVAAALQIQRAADQQQAALTSRFDARQATASLFIQAFVEDVFEREQTVAARVFGGPVNPEAFGRDVSNQGFGAAVLLDADGRLLVSSPANPALVGQDVTDRYPHLDSAVSGVPTVSGVVPSAAEGEPVIGFAAPFETPQGRRVISGAYLVEDTPLAPFVRNATPFKTAEVLLVDDNGVVIAANKSGLAGRNVSAAAPDIAAMTAASGYIGSGDTEQYLRQGQVAGTTWQLVFVVSTDELLAPLRVTGRWVLWAGLGAFALATLLALGLFYRYLVQRARLFAADARRRAILDTAGEAFIGMNERGTITDWNNAATSLFGWTPDEAVGEPLVHLLVPPDQRDAHLASVDRFLSAGRTALPEEPAQLSALRRDGTCVDVELSVSRMRWGSGWHFHAFLRDITERLQHEAQMRELALTDSLTGLANRRAALDRLDQALARARRREAPVAVVYIDVDKFKAVNDRFGHATGDAVLTTVADRLRATFRTEDTIARLGGDEFVVVCEDLRLREDLNVLVVRTRTALAQPYVVGAQRLHLTASVGTAVSDGATTVERLLNHADAEMYDAKATRQALSSITDDRG